VEEDVNGNPKAGVELKVPRAVSDAVREYIGMDNKDDMEAKTKYYEGLALERDMRHKKYGK